MTSSLISSFEMISKYIDFCNIKKLPVCLTQVGIRDANSVKLSYEINITIVLLVIYK